MSRSSNLKCSHWLGATLLVLCQAGCVHDVDAVFCEHEPCAQTDPPILPFLPDGEAIQRCEECSQDKCAELRDECLKDDVCTAQLGCLGQCSDPGCWEACRGSVGLEELFPWGFSAFYQDLKQCTFFQCAAECKGGDNWDCTEDYTLPVAATPSVDAYVRFGTGRLPYGNSPGIRDFLAGAGVEACYGSLGGCDAMGAAVLLDAGHGAHLSLSTQGASGTFEGYFELLPAAATLLAVKHRIYPLFHSHGGTFEAFYLPAGVLGQGNLPSSEEASLMTAKMDCALVPAVGGDIRVIEQYGTEILGQTIDTTRGPATVFKIPVEGDGQMVTIQFTAEGEDDLTTWRDVLLSPGWMTSIPLLPQPALY